MPTQPHKPGNFAPDHFPPISVQLQHKPTAPNKPPAVGIQAAQQNAPATLLGDLAYLSISSQPFFSQFVPMQHWPHKGFVRKSEYQYLHQLPAELLQDIESEPVESPKLPDLAIVDNFRKVYDDFHTRISGTGSLTGKKKVPETRPYVLFLMIYDLCKREAKRLALQEVEVSIDFTLPHSPCVFFSVGAFHGSGSTSNTDRTDKLPILSAFICVSMQGYTPELLKELHETSSFSSARQLHTLFKRLLDQKSISARDFHTRVGEIMIGNLKISWRRPRRNRCRIVCIAFDGREILNARM